MNKKIDEVYMILLKAKQSIYEYSKNKVKNKNWQPIYNGVIEQIDDIIVNYSIDTKMSVEEIMDCLFEIGADDKKSIFNETYNSIKMNL